MHLTEERAERIVARRGELREAIVELDEALTQPVTPAWCHGVRDALDAMAWTLATHVEQTELPDGVLHDVERATPWLAPRVAQLRRDHALLVDRTAALVDRCHEDPDPEDIREDALRLLGELTRHRHRGADLLFQAFGHGDG